MSGERKGFSLVTVFFVWTVGIAAGASGKGELRKELDQCKIALQKAVPHDR